mmetsp:Transcript_141530/g.257227  ORF Transcript_141530/g.257227 Transcript_141530/m.257227 type:complete len:639 (-) Transcript_141530:89-2005(-)
MALRTTFFVHLICGVATANNFCETEQGTLSDACSDQGASFLQHSGNALSPRRVKLHNQGNTSLTAVQGIDCETYSKPLQAMMTADGFAVKELDIIAGTYEVVYTIPWTAGGGYEDLNACGINPVDSILYCVMWAEGPYIVRIDSTTVEFVARLPWGTYISGAFAPVSERFYISTLNAEFLMIDGLSEKVSYADKANAEDMKSIGPRQKPSGFSYSADCVAMNQDLQGNGEEEYIMSLYGPKLQIAKYDPTSSTFSQSWVIAVRPPRWDNIYGAGWNFQNKVFFASNRGSGVYRVPMRNFSLREVDAFDDPDYEMYLEWMGDSETVGSNDGMSCMNAKSPWIIPFDCTDHPGPVQAFWRDGHYDVDKLNTTTGNYTNLFKVMKNETTPPFRVLNAWGINPADSIIYAAMVIDEWNDDIYPTPPPFYIVRVDDTKVRFIAKVQAPFGSPIAGAFDSQGTYYVVSNPSLLAFPDLSTFRSYEDREDARLPTYSTESDFVTIRNMSGAAQIADIAAIDVDLGDGSGVISWVMAANTALQLVLMNPAAGTYHVIPTNDVLDGHALEGNWERMNMGAAWTFEGRVFFATNDGAGVFEVPVSEVQFPFTSAVTLTRVGSSAPIHDNDGLNCVDNPSPWPAAPAAV